MNLASQELQHFKIINKFKLTKSLNKISGQLFDI